MSRSLLILAEAYLPMLPREWTSPLLFCFGKIGSLVPRQQKFILGSTIG